jgi:hypothetical protein
MARAKAGFQAQAHQPPAVYDLIGGLEAAAPAVTRLLLKDAADFDRLSIRQRGDNDWIAVLKAFDADGSPVVCFGMGYDFISCLLGLQGSVAGGKWRPDKPWGGP